MHTNLYFSKYKTFHVTKFGVPYPFIEMLLLWFKSIKKIQIIFENNMFELQTHKKSYLIFFTRFKCVQRKIET